MIEAMVKDLEAQVIELVEQVADLEVPAADAELFETGVLDSMGMIDLLTKLEERFGIEIDIEELALDAFQTPASIAAFLRTQI